MDASGRPYEDDIDERESDVDPLMHELNDDPTRELQIPPDELKDELDKTVLDDAETGNDDMRETIEDQDEDNA